MYHEAIVSVLIYACDLKIPVRLQQDALSARPDRQGHTAISQRRRNVLRPHALAELQDARVVGVLDDVVPIARVPDIRVVPLAAVHPIPALAARQGIVPALTVEPVAPPASKKRIIAAVAGDGIVAVAALEGEPFPGCHWSHRPCCTAFRYRGRPT